MKVEGGQPWEGPALWSLSPIILCDQKCFYRCHQQTQPTPPPLAFSHDIKPSKPTNGCCLNWGNSGLLAGSKRKKKWPLFRVAYWSICLCLQYLPWYLEAEGAAISQHSLTHVTHSSPPPTDTHTPPPPFLVDYSFNFLKAEASIGIVQLQERGIGWGCWKAVGIYKCCERSEIWEPYFNTCEAERARTPSCTQTRVRRHTSA